MKIQIFSVLDAVSNMYGHPLYAINAATAVRNAGDQVNNDPQFRAHASDYALYHIGEFDDNAGTILPKDKPEFVVQLASLVKQN